MKKEEEEILQEFERITGEDIRNRKNRKGEAVDYRRMVIATIRNNVKLSDQKIGNIFNPSYEHATVFHHYKVHNNYMDTSVDYKEKYLLLLSKMSMNLKKNANEVIKSSIKKRIKNLTECRDELNEAISSLKDELGNIK